MTSVTEPMITACLAKLDGWVTLAAVRDVLRELALFRTKAPGKAPLIEGKLVDVAVAAKEELDEKFASDQAGTGITESAAKNQRDITTEVYSGLFQTSDQDRRNKLMILKDSAADTFQRMQRRNGERGIRTAGSDIFRIQTISHLCLSVYLSCAFLKRCGVGLRTPTCLLSTRQSNHGQSSDACGAEVLKAPTVPRLLPWQSDLNTL